VRDRSRRMRSSRDARRTPTDAVRDRSRRMRSSSDALRIRGAAVPNRRDALAGVVHAAAEPRACRRVPAAASPRPRACGSPRGQTPRDDGTSAPSQVPSCKAIRTLLSEQSPPCCIRSDGAAGARMLRDVRRRSSVEVVFEGRGRVRRSRSRSRSCSKVAVAVVFEGRGRGRVRRSRSRSLNAPRPSSPRALRPPPAARRASAHSPSLRARTRRSPPRATRAPRRQARRARSRSS
jgi:hypothetical protein